MGTCRSPRARGARRDPGGRSGAGGARRGVRRRPGDPADGVPRGGPSRCGRARAGPVGIATKLLEAALGEVAGMTGRTGRETPK